MLVYQGILRAFEEVKTEGFEDHVWVDFQTRAEALIQLCLADDVMYHITNFSSPVEVWRKSERINEMNGDSSKFSNIVQNNDLDCSNRDLLLVLPHQTSDSWILDKGYLFHMTLNKD